MTKFDLTEFEVGGTISTGVRLYCPECERWFADWTSREPFPSVQRLIDACSQHAGECDSDR